MFGNSRWRLDGYMEARSWDFASLNGLCLTVPCVRCSKIFAKFCKMLCMQWKLSAYCQVNTLFWLGP